MDEANFSKFSNEVDWMEQAQVYAQVADYVFSKAFQEKEEWESTRRKKDKFLEVYEKTLGTITISADQAGVNRRTFYNWMKDDKEFYSAIAQINENRDDMVEDRLMKLIQEGNSSSVQFYLDRRNAKYKKTSKIELENVTGRSLEEQLYQMAENKRMLEEKQ